MNQINRGEKVADYCSSQDNSQFNHINSNRQQTDDRKYSFALWQREGEKKEEKARMSVR